LTASANRIEFVMSLRGEIEAIATATPPPKPEGELSYSLGLSAGYPSISATEQTISSIIASVRRTLAKLAAEATLETAIDDSAARSVLTYDGRVASVFPVDLSSASQAALAAAHLDSLQRTFALRMAFAGAIAAAGGTMVAIAVAISNPLTMLHALYMARALQQSLDSLVTAVEQAT